MKVEFKKIFLFGILISFLTSLVLGQGFNKINFYYNWLTLIPKTYLLVLPFVLITGSIIRTIINRIVKLENIKV